MTFFSFYASHLHLHTFSGPEPRSFSLWALCGQVIFDQMRKIRQQPLTVYSQSLSLQIPPAGRKTKLEKCEGCVKEKKKVEVISGLMLTASVTVETDFHHATYV